ncbi:MAG TPA: hypothetical protein VIS05_09975 [Ilumatobacter sp.]
MATQRESPSTIPEPDTRPDDERLVDETAVASGVEVPLDAPIGAPIEDVVEQRMIEPTDDDDYAPG